MSLGRKLRVFQVLQERPGLRLDETTIATYAGVVLVHVELASLIEDGWVASEHTLGSPRVYWLKERER